MNCSDEGSSINWTTVREDLQSVLERHGIEKPASGSGRPTAADGLVVDLQFYVKMVRQIEEAQRKGRPVTGADARITIAGKPIEPFDADLNVTGHARVQALKDAGVIMLPRLSDIDREAIDKILKNRSVGKVTLVPGDEVLTRDAFVQRWMHNCPGAYVAMDGSIHREDSGLEYEPVECDCGAEWCEGWKMEPTSE